jgi:outer membrane protein TolC
MVRRLRQFPSLLSRAGLLLTATAAFAAEPNTIDLPTTLKLAGANNLDVQIAREKVTEARAASDSARAKFFPWIAPSVVVRRHEENIQAVNGPIIDADKQSLAAGIALNAEINLGETYYQNLVAKQLVKSSEAALAGRQRDAVYRAAIGYFDRGGGGREDFRPARGADRCDRRGGHHISRRCGAGARGA